MLGTIVNTANSIRIEYNDLSQMDGVDFRARTIPKAQILYIALEKSELYVEVNLKHDQVFQITFGMFEQPVCQNNRELYDSLKIMLE